MSRKRVNVELLPTVIMPHPGLQVMVEKELGYGCACCG